MDAKQFIADLPDWDGVPRHPALETASKDDLMAAAVTWPVLGGFDPAQVQPVVLRPPYSRGGRMFLVDASKLRAA